MIGTKVIVRSSPSGCWYGEMVERTADIVTLRNARRLWRWWAAEGVSLSGVASHGLHPKHLHECRIAVPVETVIIMQTCEILSTTEAAQASIEAQPAVSS